MPKGSKPSVKLNCPANAYSTVDERIVEFSAVTDDGELLGGLISIQLFGKKLRVQVYRCDEHVTVIGPKD